MKKARCTSLAVQAGRTLFIDLPAVVRRADELGLPGIIVGKAIYENRITLKDLAACLQNG